MTQSHDRGGAEQLKAFVERLERLAGERDDLNIDIRAVRAEAKGQGFDLLTISAILKRRKLEPAAVIEADALLETYEQALGCGAAAGGVRQTTRGADGTFQVSIATPAAADEKLSKATKARQGAMALAELAKRAREG